MQASFLLGTFLLLPSDVFAENAWEMSRMDVATREADLAIREEKRANTSIIAYNKSQMSDKEADAEKSRITEKCKELKCPCDVLKLAEVGVLEVTWKCDNHPSVKELGLDSEKETGAEDQILHIDCAPFLTDPLFSEQWALQDLDNYAGINIDEGWDEYLSDRQGGDPNGPSVIVAVIDTGVDYSHTDLRNSMWTNSGEIAGDGIDNDGNGIVDDVYGAEFVSNTNGAGDPMDRHGHGTHCAGVIAATPNNGEGITGVASFTQGKVKIMALKAIADSGYGTMSAFLACLNYAIDKGAKISSNSWGGGTIDGWEEVWDAVLRNNLDHLFIASAGNFNKEINDEYKKMSCGLKEPNLLCVASSTKDDEKSIFSDYGTDYVHVFAPGSSILSTVPDNRYEVQSGTSMACPMVSGLAALVLTMRDGMSAQEVRQVIEANVGVKPEYVGYVSSSGLIDVGATIMALKNQTEPTCKANLRKPTCDYGKYCEVVDCNKTGAATLCPDQCSK